MLNSQRSQDGKQDHACKEAHGFDWHPLLSQIKLQLCHSGRKRVAYEVACQSSYEGRGWDLEEQGSDCKVKPGASNQVRSHWCVAG